MRPQGRTASAPSLRRDQLVPRTTISACSAMPPASRAIFPLQVGEEDASSDKSATGGLGGAEADLRPPRLQAASPLPRNGLVQDFVLGKGAALSREDQDSRTGRRRHLNKDRALARRATPVQTPCARRDQRALPLQGCCRRGSALQASCTVSRAAVQRSTTSPCRGLLPTLDRPTPAVLAALPRVPTECSEALQR
jgi:hypothetical protein